jgi:hypothetical protein
MWQRLFIEWQPVNKKKERTSWVWWYMPVIPATQEVEA